jgi:general secretion pathway protein D
MMNIVDQLDIPRLQVQVEVMIVEISQQKAAQLGVTWATDGANNDELLGLTNFSIGGGIIPLATASQGETPNPSAIGAGLTAGLGRIRDSGTSWAAIVNALRGDGDANIVATATVVTLDNEPASINVGQDVPVLGSRAIQPGAGGQQGGPINPFIQNQNIDRREIGTKLDITPQINASDGVKLTIAQEQSSVAPSVEGAADIILNTRNIENVVFVRNGDVLVLGGLVDDQLRTNEERVPGLGRIPGLGWLFKARRTERQKTNLMVFIRPTILHDQAEAAAYTKGKYSDIRGVQQELAEKPVPLMRDVEQPILPPFPAPAETPASNDAAISPLD